MKARRNSNPQKKTPPRRFRRWLIWSSSGVAVVFLLWVIYLDLEVREKFDGRKWALPARVYAQPLEFYNGRLLNLEDLRYQLQVLDYRPVEIVTRQGLWSYRSGQVELFIRTHEYQGKAVPARRVRFTLRGDRVQGLQVLEGDAAFLVSLEPALIGGIYPRRQEDRELVQLPEVPTLLGEALIAVEDRGFVQHHGISLKGITRAAVANFKSGRVVQGGSTLTQQLVKNFFLTESRDLSRKVTEAIMSLLVELHYSKSEILETYINEVYLGQSGPRQVHGFGLAAKHYFQRPLQDLETHEISLLVGLVKGASFYNPWRHPERALRRRNLVLGILAREGLLDQAAASQAQSQPLGIVAETERHIRAYPAFIELVKNQLQREYSDEALSSDGLSIYTTLSLSAQHRAERALAERLQSLEERHRLQAFSLQGAVIMTAVGSGEVEAVVGDRNSRFAGFNRALDAQRPIGSLVKPAVYLAALSQTGGMHLASRISDEPVELEIATGKLWQPGNFDNKSHGEVLLIDALANSYNQATVRLGTTLGLDKVSHSLRQLGVDREIPEVPALLLGAIELSPLAVSAMYHTLANDGVVVPLRAIRSVVDAGGVQLSRYPLTVSEGVDPATASLMQYALQVVMREGTGKIAYHRLSDALVLGGKTGTTNDQRDSWFAGFSGKHLGVVWLGRDDNGPTPLTGSGGALQVWSDIFAGLPTASLDILLPAEVEYLWVDPSSGGLSGENCRGARLMPFKRASQPTEKAFCQWVENPVLHWLKKWL